MSAFKLVTLCAICLATTKDVQANYLGPNTVLWRGQSIQSIGKKYTLTMQTDGGLVMSPEFAPYLKYRGTIVGRDELEKIHSKKLASSPENVKLVRELLAMRSSDDERAILISILGRLYDHKNTSGQNAAIKGDLKELARSGEGKIARPAVFSISRMGGAEELKDLLQQSKSSGHIDNDTYAGEIAHNVRFYSPTQQLQYIALLKQSGSKYGIDVLTSELSSQNFLGQYAPGSLTEIDDMLDKSEPNFPFAIGEFSYIDGMRFISWMQARAAIRNQGKREPSYDFILRKLSDPKLDPRKAISYLNSPEAAPFLSNVKRGALDPVLARIHTYADSLPQNQLIQESATSIFNRINTLPR